MRIRAAVVLVSSVGLTLVACQDTSGPGQVRTVVFRPPSAEFVTRLDITPPVNADEAKAIGVEAAGGTATDVVEEMEDGELIFEVQVDTPTGPMEVEVRASDGTVAEMEPADGPERRGS